MLSFALISLADQTQSRGRPRGAVPRRRRCQGRRSRAVQWAPRQSPQGRPELLPRARCPAGRHGRSAGLQGGRGPGGRRVHSRAPGALRPGRPDRSAASDPRPQEASSCAGPWSQQYLLGSAGDAGGAWRGVGAKLAGLGETRVGSEGAPRGTTGACPGPKLRGGGGAGARSFPVGVLQCTASLPFTNPLESHWVGLSMLPLPDSHVSV